MRNIIIASLALLALVACHADKPTAPAKPKAAPAFYRRNADATVRIIAYDVYNQKIAEGQGAYVAHDVVVTSMQWLKGAFSAKVMALDNRQPHNVYGFSALDLDHDLVALRVAKRNPNFAPRDTSTAVPDSLHMLHFRDRKLLRTQLRFSADTLNASATDGTPLYNLRGELSAMAHHGNRLISARIIDSIARHMSESHENLYDLRLKTNKVYPSHTRIRGFRIRTQMGSIVIALSDLTPEYRDNFIRLVSDNFYDSLLVHRVLTGYLIQTGAADSKHAAPDDVVGWQGPGYKLPMHVVPSLFHKRGAVAASKLPQDHNTTNRSDGSQFFIVAGRRFTNDELTQVEAEYHKHFTPQQREAYTTVGGAPYLDGDYTVFGHVVEGLDVVDRISQVPLRGDRPAQDIRITDVEILYK